MHWKYHSLILSHENKINSLAQDCSNSGALAKELLQSCTKQFQIGGLVRDYNIFIANALEIPQSHIKPWKKNDSRPGNI